MLYEIIMVPYSWRIFDIVAHDVQMRVRASCKAQDNDLESNGGDYLFFLNYDTKL